MSRILREYGDGPAFHHGVRIGDMLEACDTLRAHAPSPHHIVPGDDPLVMGQYPAPRPEQGVVVRLDVMPRG